MRNIHLVYLQYDITFNDADDGRCFAGVGQKLIAAFEQPANAEALRKGVAVLLPLAEAEYNVFPVQPANRKLKDLIGFTLHDIGQDEENYRVVVETTELQDRR
jgi:hypothetical protein